MKKAMLVEFSLLTRVVVDVPDIDIKNLTDDDVVKIAESAKESIRQSILEDRDYPYIENMVEFKEDEEVPYGTLNEEL